MYRHTNRTLEDKALKRRQRYNEKTKEAPIYDGNQVLLRNLSPGRNKIQDTWKSTPYVVNQNLGNNVHKVQLADNTGQCRTVTRTEILDTGDHLSVSSEDDEWEIIQTVEECASEKAGKCTEQSDEKDGNV